MSKPLNPQLTYVHIHVNVSIKYGQEYFTEIHLNQQSLTTSVADLRLSPLETFDHVKGPITLGRFGNMAFHNSKTDKKKGHVYCMSLLIKNITNIKHMHGSMSQSHKPLTLDSHDQVDDSQSLAASRWRKGFCVYQGPKVVESTLCPGLVMLVFSTCHIKPIDCFKMAMDILHPLHSLK